MVLLEFYGFRYYERDCTTTRTKCRNSWVYQMKVRKEISKTESVVFMGRYKDGEGNFYREVDDWSPQYEVCI